MADSAHLALVQQGVGAWNAWKSGRRAALFTADLRRADLRNHDLQGIDLYLTDLREADLRGADLRRANMTGAMLSDSDLREANLSGAHLHGAHLNGVKLNHAHLIESHLIATHFDDADLRGANLTGAILIGTDFTNADLSGCCVYGISAWRIVLEQTKQSDLVITSHQEPAITLDNLELAQFIYLMAHSRRLREVIDTLTSKVVLILGRFTPERKSVLDALRTALRSEHDYVPVVFDFDQPVTRDTEETVTLLARMARFIIADITDARSIPQELAVVVRDLPSVPVQPLLHESSTPWGMWDHSSRYPWVLPICRYSTVEALLPQLKELVIGPAEAKLIEMRPKH
jgi:hypothetical protein